MRKRLFCPKRGAFSFRSLNVTDPFQLQANDVGIKYIEPQSQTDARVPIPGEFALGSKISYNLFRKSQTLKGWTRVPKFSIDQTNQHLLKITDGLISLPNYPGLIGINYNVTIKPLDTNSSVVKRRDFLSVISFVAEVGAEQDPVLGKVSFKYRDQGTQAIRTIEKENARRYRVFWGLILSVEALTINSFTNSLGLGATGLPKLNVTNKLESGFALSPGIQFYASDPNLTIASYLLESDSIEIANICFIDRIQNFPERGYIWGHNGEEAIDPDYAIAFSGVSLEIENLETIVQTRLYQIFSGIPGSGSTYARAVENLTSGAVANNPGRMGEAAESPNKSVAMANDQRVSFTNQGGLSTRSVQIVTATNNGEGKAVVAASLNTNAPVGSYFSSDREAHKIYGIDGTEQSALGSFQNLGGSGALIWTAGVNATIKPGQKCYFVPAVFYPPGSGISLPFSKIEKIWRNSIELNKANIRMAYGADVDAYETPTNNEKFLVVYGPERSAIVHYIYEKISVTTDSTGKLFIPDNERGNFAFIEGVSGRIDAPVKTGLIANKEYNALVYYPPRTLESWQLQIKYCKYQGTKEADFLNNSVIISKPLFFATTQGSGNSVFQGEASLRFSPISMHLPRNDDETVPAYTLDGAIHLTREAYPGPITFRELPIQTGTGLVLPSPGLILSATNASRPQNNCLQLKLFVDGKRLGFRTPELADSRNKNYQAILAFVVRKGNERRLVMATYNGAGGITIAIDSDEKVAIDTFKL